jgi:hypothetical protein
LELVNREISSVLTSDTSVFRQVGCHFDRSRHQCDALDPFKKRFCVAQLLILAQASRIAVSIRVSISGARNPPDRTSIALARAEESCVDLKPISRAVLGVNTWSHPVATVVVQLAH